MRKAFAIGFRSLRAGAAALGVSSALFVEAPAQKPFPELKPLLLESRSQQFKVVGYPVGTALGPPSLSYLLTNHVQMEPTILVLTAERVRTELLAELGLGEAWAGRITITVQGDLPPTSPVVVVSQWFPGGWRYQMIVPGQLDRPRLLRALTRALLLEVANRNNASQRSAEIPLWLEEGLATHLLALHGETLVPEVRTRMAVIRTASPDVFADARQLLRGRALVSFSDLSLITADQLHDAQWQVFHRTSQLLVAELLNLPEGRATLTEFLRCLPAYLNSQLAFQRAFAGRFPTMLDAEKWWSVVWINFTASARYMRLSLAHSLDQLDEVLAAPITVRLGTDAVPSRKDLPLRELVANTDFQQHGSAVARAALQLQLLQVNSPVELGRLAGDYRQALLNYLKRRSTFSSRSSSASADAKLALKEVIEKLDLLDVIRFDFRRLDTAPGGACPPAPE
ncbi:MAG: hypothetical protein FJ392_02345 [Verrucomicrobia bacterium]|nr:hypothetical protein [Verrucomicrobiota bacterium]